MARTRGRWLGFLLVALGVVFLLDSTGTFDVGYLTRTYWPVLLVLWGVALLTRPGFGRRRGSFTPASSPAAGGSGSGSPGDSLDSSNVFGGVDIHVSSPAFRGGSATTVFGDISIDCHSGGLADGEHDLTVSGVFGDSRVIVPPGVALQVTAHTLAGDVAVMDQKREGISASVRYSSPGFDGAPKRLRVRISQVFGDIDVHQ
jgi:hypothetical protein